METLWVWLAIGLGTIWAGLGIWMIGKAWLESIARNPEGNYFVPAILAIALAEATAIYALVIALLIS